MQVHTNIKKWYNTIDIINFLKLYIVSRGSYNYEAAICSASNEVRTRRSRWSKKGGEREIN